MATIKSINKENLNNFVMVAKDLGANIYIGKSLTGDINIVDKIEDAEVWSHADTLSVKLNYHRAVTGLDLVWEKI